MGLRLNHLYQHQTSMNGALNFEPQRFSWIDRDRQDILLSSTSVSPSSRYPWDPPDIRGPPKGKEQNKTC